MALSFIYFPTTIIAKTLATTNAIVLIAISTATTTTTTTTTTTATTPATTTTISPQTPPFSDFSSLEFSSLLRFFGVYFLS